MEERKAFFLKGQCRENMSTAESPDNWPSKRKKMDEETLVFFVFNKPANIYAV